MSKNRIHSTEELEKYILMFMDGISHRELKHKHGLKLSAGRFREYVKRYEAHGLAGIMYTEIEMFISYQTNFSYGLF